VKYIANPVEVEAFKIIELGQRDFAGQMVTLDDASERLVTPEQMARMEPAIGDYFVIQSDGYIYINPKAVFERKYSYDPPCGETLRGNDSHPTLICGERKSRHTPEAARADVGMDHAFVAATFD
jgi:hypothetical protein